MKVEVTQADREMAASVLSWGERALAEPMRCNTSCDGHPLVQAFARHRIGEPREATPS